MNINAESAKMTSITASSQIVTVEATTRYLVCAIGNTCYVKSAGPGVTTVTASATAAGSFPVPQGTFLGPIQFDGTKVAVIGAAAAGRIYLLKVNRSWRSP